MSSFVSFPDEPVVAVPAEVRRESPEVNDSN